uniref:Speckle-type POZ protein n=1 Tax=Plectus sambesii TaxID=2011161 RepID=A0A914XFU3_9BILA
MPANCPAVSLLPAADKYAIDSLRDICVANMLDDLTVENAYEMLLVAEKHSIKELKNECIALITQNSSPLAAKNRLDALEANPSLLEEAFASLLRRKETKPVSTIAQQCS